MGPTVFIRHSSYVCFGKEFSFDPASKRSREAAALDAREYGSQVLDAMRKQAGRELTDREESQGYLDIPKPAKIDVTTNKEDGPRNPYTSRIRELEAQYSATNRNTLEVYRRESDRWEEQRERERAIEARNRHPDVIRMRESSSSLFGMLRLDPHATPAEVEAARLLDAEAKGDSLSTGDYWKRRDDLIFSHYARQDAEQAQKEAEAKAERERLRQGRQDAEQHRRELDQATGGDDARSE